MGKLMQHMHEEAVKKVEFFRYLSDNFITELMFKMSSEFYSPFSIIIGQGSIGASMYVVRKGFAAVYRGGSRQSISSTVILGPGQAFGEISLLADDLTRTASVVALEWTDLAVINKCDFDDLIEFFPQEKFKMQKYAEKKISHWKQIRKREEEEKQLERKRRRSGSHSISQDIRRYRSSIGMDQQGSDLDAMTFDSDADIVIVDNETYRRKKVDDEIDTEEQGKKEIDAIFEANPTWQKVIVLIQQLHASKTVWQRHLKKNDGWKKIWANQDAKEKQRTLERVEKAEQRLKKKSSGLIETDDTKNTPTMNAVNADIAEEENSASRSTSFQTKNRMRLPSFHGDLLLGDVQDLGESSSNKKSPTPTSDRTTDLNKITEDTIEDLPESVDTDEINIKMQN